MNYKFLIHFRLSDFHPISIHAFFSPDCNFVSFTFTPPQSSLLIF